MDCHQKSTPKSGVLKGAENYQKGQNREHIANYWLSSKNPKKMNSLEQTKGKKRKSFPVHLFDRPWRTTSAKRMVSKRPHELCFMTNIYLCQIITYAYNKQKKMQTLGSATTQLSESVIVANWVVKSKPPKTKVSSFSGLFAIKGK